MSYVLAFEQCLALDFIAKVAVIMWLWAKLWIVDSTVIRNRTLFWVIFFQNLNKNHMDPAGMPGTQQSYPPLRQRNRPGASENPNFASLVSTNIAFLY